MNSTDTQQDAFSCVELNKVKAFKYLQRNAYRRRQVDLMRLRQQHFEIICHLANTARVFEVVRPSDGAEIDPFIDFLLTWLPEPA